MRDPQNSDDRDSRERETGRRGTPARTPDCMFLIIMLDATEMPMRQAVMMAKDTTSLHRVLRTAKGKHEIHTTKSLHGFDAHANITI